MEGRSKVRARWNFLNILSSLLDKRVTELQMNSLWRQNQPTKSKERPKFCVKCNYSIDQFVLRDLLTSVKFCVKCNYSLDQFVLRDLLTSFNSSKQIKGNVEAMSRQSLKQNKENTSSTDSFQYLTTIKKEFLLFTSFSIMLRPFDQGFNKWYDTPICLLLKSLPRKCKLFLYAKLNPPSLPNYWINSNSTYKDECWNK